MRMNELYMQLRKPLAMGVLAAATLGGCTGAPTQNAPRSGETMMKVYASFKDAWHRRDANAIAAHFHPDGTYLNPAAGPQPISGPAIAGFTGALFTAIPDFQVDVVKAAPLNEKTVAEQWVIKGTWTQPFPGGPLAGLKPTGKSFAVPGSGFLEIDNGKIRNDTIYFDRMSFLTQIGVIDPKK